MDNYHTIIENAEDIIKDIDNDNAESFSENVSCLPDWQNCKLNPEKGMIINYIIKKKATKILKSQLDLDGNKILHTRDEANLKNIIHMAIEESCCDIIREFLSREEDVEFTKDIEGNNELHKWVTFHFACEECLKYFQKYIKYHSEYLTDQNIKGNNPLHSAVIDGSLKVCQLLMKYFHFDLNLPGESENTLLHLCARHNDIVLSI
jgi:ankyrin repeat protein